MTEKIIRKTSLGYRVWRFTHWWREDKDFRVRQTNSCKFFWRLVLMSIPAALGLALWTCLLFAVWMVVSVFTVLSVSGIWTPGFGRWVKFPEVLLLETRRRRFTLQGVVAWIMGVVILAGVVGMLVTALSDVTWGGFWEGLKGSLRFLLMMLVIGAVWYLIKRLYEIVANWVRRQKEKVCHIINFE